MRQLVQALLREGSLSSGSNIQPLLHPRAAHIQHLILHSSKAFDAMYTHNHTLFQISPCKNRCWQLSHSHICYLQQLMLKGEIEITLEVLQPIGKLN